jgi:hypothetical protein
MEKEVRNFKIDYSLNWTYGVEIKKLREDLEALEKLGATHVEIEPGISYDCPYVEINAMCERIETDEEFKARIDEVNRRQEENKRRELEQLERLKLKYGK